MFSGDEHLKEEKKIFSDFLSVVEYVCFEKLGFFSLSHIR